MDRRARSAGLAERRGMENRLPRLDTTRGVVPPTAAEARSLDVDLTPRGEHLATVATGTRLDGPVDMTVVRTPRGSHHLRAISAAVRTDLTAGPAPHPVPPLNTGGGAPGHINTVAPREEVVAAAAATFTDGTLDRLTADSGHFNNLGAGTRAVRAARASRIGTNTRALAEMLEPVAAPGATVQSTEFGVRGSHSRTRNFMRLSAVLEGRRRRAGAAAASVPSRAPRPTGARGLPPAAPRGGRVGARIAAAGAVGARGLPPVAPRGGRVGARIAAAGAVGARGLPPVAPRGGRAGARIAAAGAVGARGLPPAAPRGGRVGARIAAVGAVAGRAAPPAVRGGGRAGARARLQADLAAAAVRGQARRAAAAKSTVAGRSATGR